MERPRTFKQDLTDEAERGSCSTPPSSALPPSSLHSMLSDSAPHPVNRARRDAAPGCTPRNAAPARRGTQHQLGAERSTNSARNAAPTRRGTQHQLGAERGTDSAPGCRFEEGGSHSGSIVQRLLVDRLQWMRCQIFPRIRARHGTGTAHLIIKGPASSPAFISGPSIELGSIGIPLALGRSC